MAIYLGFDSSTQSLTAIAIEVDGSRREVVFERSLNFDADFPAYGTKNGVLPGDEPLVATSSPLLWAEALERMMGLIAKESGLDLSRVRAISGSGQQHGSVYLNAAGSRALTTLDPGRPLAAQLAGAFSRERSPIWMDASTAAQSAEITSALGGAAAVTRLTGARAFERFTGPQIRKFWQAEPAAYGATETIHLVSSFGASLLAGRNAPIDPGDGAGMTLMDLAHGRWSPAALDATAPDLVRKLPPLGESWAVVGSLAEYWRRRHGFPGAKVIAWSGDNPCSLVGVGLAAEGTIAISLGTSDTIFGPMAAARTDPTLSGCVFGSPTGGYMGITVFSNGSLARERIRDEHGLDWAGFAGALRETKAGNGGAVLLPWFEAEITPNVLEPGVRRYGGLAPGDGAANVRAVVEAQMLSLATHSQWMGVTVRQIRATGGAASNREILQVMADVHNADVRRLKVGNSACLGAALRAWHADELSEGRTIPWSEIVAGFVEPEEPAIRPIAANVPVYVELKKVYAACEVHALGKGPDPEPLIRAFRQRYGDAGGG